MTTTPKLANFLALDYSAGGGPLTARVSQRIGAVLAWAAGRLGLSPNAVTVLAGLLSLVTSALYFAAPMTWQILLLCLVLYQLAYALDCADGQLARATARTSEFGGWLDVSVDCIVVVAQAYAVLHVLVGQYGQSELLYGVMWLYTATQVLSIYSSNAQGRSAHAARPERKKLNSSLKQLLWFFVDTPVLLAVICLLRNTPVMLFGFVLAISGVYALKILYNGAQLQKA